MSRNSKHETAEVMVVESSPIVPTFKVDVDVIPDLSCTREQFLRHYNPSG